MQMKKSMYTVLKKLPASIALTIAATLFSIAAMAQTVITGRVTESKNGNPLAGTTVTVQGTKTSTQTGSDGTFKITVPANAKTLVFTSVGYSSQSVAIGGAAVNVSLVESSQQLTDVVVVAYGTRKKGDLTGAVTQISAKDFQKGNNNSPEQLLQGKVAGLQITSGGGSPGGGSRLRIRGGASLNSSNDPLIVIDGVPVEGNGIRDNKNILNTINPNDIESMSVLKDASATALYGSRASNGVLIISTKKGSKGKLRVNFNSQATVGEVTKTADVLSAADITKIVTESGNEAYIDLLGNSNTDWQKQIYQKANGWDNNISLSGALADVLPFRVSLGYLSQEGIVKTDKFNRMSADLNLSPKFLDNHLSVNVNFKLMHTKNIYADGGAVGAAASFDPTQSINADNKFGGYFEWLQTTNGIISPKGNNGNATAPNPLGLLKYKDNQGFTDRMLGNVQLDYQLHFLPDLHVQANLGVDHTEFKADYLTDSISVASAITNGYAGHVAEFKNNQLADVSLFYTKELPSIKSKFDILVGHSYQDFATDVFNYRAYKRNHDTIPGTTPTYPTDKPEFRLESYYGRLNYSLADKYLLTASLRRDASSKFAPENRIGYFPAAAFAWKLNEDFFKGSPKISELKLRLGWGITGQQDGIGYYDYITRYTTSASTAQYQFGNSFTGFYWPPAVDPSLKWETTTTSNIGLDFGFFNNRISGSIDVYRKKTKDLLSTIPVGPGQNYNIELRTNVGNLENKGIEFTLNTVPVRKKDISWDFGFNVTYNNTKVTNLLKVQDPAFKGIAVGGIQGGTGNNIEKHVVGYAPYTFFVYKQVYDEATGKPIEGLYEDINRDGQITDDDRYLYKKVAPDILFGINTQLNYKKWYLGFAAHGTIGNYLYNNFASRTGVFNNILNGSQLISNGSANYLKTGFKNQQYLSDYYIENASFLRLDNINIGYNFGKIMRNTAVLRISASVQNVATITKYTGLDPEVSDDAGIDNNIYPRPRVYSIGVNLDF